MFKSHLFFRKNFCLQIVASNTQRKGTANHQSQIIKVLNMKAKIIIF